jgi:two-component system chemotaxis sensor kinase CheA
VNRIGEKPLGEILVARGAVSRDQLEAGLAQQKADPRKKLGHILVKDKKARTKEVISALRDQRTYGGHDAGLQVKVDSKKIDRFIDLTTELASCRNMLCNDEWICSEKKQERGDILNRISQLTSQLQKTALSMRMVSVNHTFQRMVRLVRDLSGSFGKEIALELAGEDTEIDSTVAGELYEPMVHMIRNAIDHGIERPEERERSGKDRVGIIHLKAYYEGNNIIVEISDDGWGLKVDQIIERAKANGFMTEGCRMSKDEIYRMIFQPGFSTALKVTAFSGRGVGLDVAKRFIEKFGGRLDVQSMPGRGSTFRLHIPRTVDTPECSFLKEEKEKAETL